MDEQWYAENSERARKALTTARVDYGSGKCLKINTPVEVGFDDLKKLVLEATGLTPTELIAKRRVKKVVNARWALIDLARRLTPLSYANIGYLLGGRDHSTVIHAVHMCRAKPETVRPIIEYVEARLG